MITSEILCYPNGGCLVVAMPETGTLIRCQRATDTFVEAIKRISIERVKSMGIKVAGIPLIPTTDSSNRAQSEMGEYYITMRLAPERMRTTLERIAERLGISPYAELFA